jgi:hypothetical protein
MRSQDKNAGFMQVSGFRSKAAGVRTTNFGFRATRVKTHKSQGAKKKCQQIISEKWEWHSS